MDNGTLSIDDDTLQALRNAWQESTDTLPTLFTEPPKAGRLENPQAVLYAQITSKFRSRLSAGSGGAWHDHREVSIIVRGQQKADVVAGVQAVLDRFNQTDANLVLPSGAKFLRWEPLNGGELTEDDTTKNANDVWVGTILADVWTVRLR